MRYDVVVIRLRFDLSYDGTDFHGWAKQADPAIRTVQAVIEDKLALIAQQPVALTVAGRTDAGVHAAGQVAHADLPASVLGHRSVGGDPRRLIPRLRKLLPPDIRIHAIRQVSTDFDARFSALARRYEYRLSCDPAGPYPVRARDTAYHPRPVDMEAMNDAASRVVGLHDFAAFSKPKPDATTVRHLYDFHFEDASTSREPSLYIAFLRADAFCWHMVRGLVGACIAIGEGRYEPSLMDTLLGYSSRSSMTPVAPACGLSLVGVDYPADDLLRARSEQTRAKRQFPLASE